MKQETIGVHMLHEHEHSRNLKSMKHKGTNLTSDATFSIVENAYMVSLLLKKPCHSPATCGIKTKRDVILFSMNLIGQTGYCLENGFRQWRSSMYGN